jgi:hypothetical protein
MTSITGTFPAKLKLLLARAILGLLVAPRRSSVSQLKARPPSNRRVAESLANRRGERRKDQSPSLRRGDK